MALKFRWSFTNCTNWEPFTKLNNLVPRPFEQVFIYQCKGSGNETIQTFRKIPLYQYLKSVDGQYPGCKLPDPQGVLSKEVPLHAISAGNHEVTVLPPSAGTKVSGMYLKGSAEKAEIGK